MQEFPATNYHDLNLDWLLEEMQQLRAEWEAWQEAHNIENAEEVDEDAPTVSGN